MSVPGHGGDDTRDDGAHAPASRRGEVAAPMVPADSEHVVPDEPTVSADARSDRADGRGRTS